MKKNNYLDLMFETSLRHLYQGEKAILDNLLAMEKNSITPQLKDIFRNHENETKKQIERLERIFSFLNIDVKASKIQGLPRLVDQAKEFLKTLADLNFTDSSKGVDGILSEGKELLRHFGNTEVNDFALVSSGQKVEHFEIACYQFLKLLAASYENQQIVQLLEESLKEELRMEKHLSKFAESLSQELMHEPVDRNSIS
jgi:ferritin-like metal-binding protein YciE